MYKYMYKAQILSSKSIPFASCKKEENSQIEHCSMDSWEGTASICGAEILMYIC